MATFDSTLGGARANSYQSLASADAFFVATLLEAEWQSYSNVEREASLMAATSVLDTMDWDGDRCNVPESVDDATRPQRLNWPREEVSCGGIAAVCSYIPDAILEAQCYLALQVAKDPSLINPGPNPVPVGLYVKRNKLGDLEQEFAEYSKEIYADKHSSDHGVVKKFPWLLDYIGCYLKSRGNRIVARVRS